MGRGEGHLSIPVPRPPLDGPHAQRHDSVMRRGFLLQAFASPFYFFVLYFFFFHWQKDFTKDQSMS